MWGYTNRSVSRSDKKFHISCFFIMEKFPFCFLNFFFFFLKWKLSCKMRTIEEQNNRKSVMALQETEIVSWKQAVYVWLRIHRATLIFYPSSFEFHRFYINKQLFLFHAADVVCDFFLSQCCCICLFSYLSRLYCTALWCTFLLSSVFYSCDAFFLWVQSLVIASWYIHTSLCFQYYQVYVIISYIHMVYMMICMSDTTVWSSAFVFVTFIFNFLLILFIIIFSILA